MMNSKEKTFMKNLDRFDDEARVGNIDASELEKQKVRTAQIKRRIMFFVKLFLYHLASMIIYGIALSSTVSADVYEERGAAKTILGFGLKPSVYLRGRRERTTILCIVLTRSR